MAQKACREGYTARYLRLPQLFEELSLAHDDGRFPKLMASFSRGRSTPVGVSSYTWRSPSCRSPLV